MKKNDYLIWLGISAAAGAVFGTVLSEANPKKGGLLGALAGVLTGSAALEVYERMTDDDGIIYYTKSSPQYEDPDDGDYV